MSLGRVRSCADNGSAESVFGQLKRQLVNRFRFATWKEAAEKIDAYFLRIYNPLRRAPLLRNGLKEIAQLERQAEK